MLYIHDLRKRESQHRRLPHEPLYASVADRSTLYRELKRNSEDKTYLSKTAQFKIEERAKEKRSTKLELNGVLRDYVIRSLQKGWSPEQIAGRMKYHQLSFYACHETIYQFIYRSKDKTLYHYYLIKNLKGESVTAGNVALVDMGRVH